MNDVVVNNTPNERLKDELNALYSTFRKLNNEPVRFDLSDCTWIQPLTALAISAYAYNVGCPILLPKSTRVAKYLQKVCFPVGVKRPEEIAVNSFTAPIGFLERDDVKRREALESRFYEVIERLTGNVAGARSAILYPISELVGNIFEHSQQSHGWIFAQHFPTKQMLEICIVDTGRGIASSYSDTRGSSFSDSDAIALALQGESTKPMIGRGTGLRTSQNVVREALNGEFVLLTGDSAFYGSPDKQRMVHLPEFRWQGVIVAYQIPYPDAPVDISQYTS